MKTIFFLCFALVAVNAADAQIFRPQPVNGAVLGRDAQVQSRQGRGEVRGERPGARGGGEQGRRYQDFHHGGVPYRHVGHVDRHYHGHGRFGYFGSPYRYSYFPRYSVFPTYGYYSGYGYGYPYYDSYGYYPAGNAATNGLLLGALAGGIIGHNSGDFRHSAWRGSAWGAGLGWLLGTVVDSNRRAAAYQAAPGLVQPTSQLQAQPAAAAQPQQVTIINHYYNSSTPMSSVNGMFGR